VNYQPEEFVGQIQLWARMTLLEHDELLTIREGDCASTERDEPAYRVRLLRERRQPRYHSPPANRIETSTNLAALPESVQIRDCIPNRLPRSCGQVPVHVSEEWISLA
jgi:hypothetical protein